MEINVTEILFQPEIGLPEIIPIDIFGEKYTKRIVMPNLFVVKTTNQLIENNERTMHVYPLIVFEINNIISELTDVIVKKKEDMYFLECKYWKQTVSDYIDIF